MGLYFLWSNPFITSNSHPSVSIIKISISCSNLASFKTKSRGRIFTFIFSTLPKLSVVSIYSCFILIDENNYIEQIREIINNYDKYVHIKENAIETAREKFSPKFWCNFIDSKINTKDRKKIFKQDDHFLWSNKHVERYRINVWMKEYNEEEFYENIFAAEKNYFRLLKK